ncbi:MAG: hypothetical protein HGA80_04610 [Candidatus Omnitrophica bacterium]|nr:hypothetical protein [Candidatus Omnitrophota bacterium]
MGSMGIIIVLCASVFLVMYYFYFLYLDVVMSRRMKDLGGKTTKIGQGLFYCKGQAVLVDYKLPDDSSAPELRLMVDTPIISKITIRKETAADVMAKGINLNNEWQMGDPELDKRLYFECDDQSFLRTWLQRVEVRTALASLMQSYSYIEIVDKHCSAIKKPCYFYLWGISSQNILDSSRRLLCLAEAIPRNMDEQCPVLTQTELGHRRRDFLLGIGSVLSFAGVLLLIVGLRFFEPLSIGALVFSSLWFSLPAVLIFMVYVVKRQAGTSIALQSICVVGAVLVSGFILVGVGGLMLLNGFMDKSKTEYHQAAIIRQSFTRPGKEDASYDVTVAGWGKECSDYTFSVPMDLYYRLSLGDICKIGVRKGVFGHEWVALHNCDLASGGTKP